MPSRVSVGRLLTEVAGVRCGSETAKSRSGKTMVAANRACRGRKCTRFSLGDRTSTARASSSSAPLQASEGGEI
jgi:hypothetical protein